MKPRVQSKGQAQSQRKSAFRIGHALRGWPLARDKADTLLLLAACALVLAPHGIVLPLWIGGTLIVMLGWRAWITLRGNRMPPRWILLPLALSAMAGIYLQYRTFWGQEAGVATLVLLLAFKLLEMRARRDLFVVIFLAFFLLLAAFFHSQSLPSAVLTVCTVVLLLTAQLSFQYTNRAPPLGQRLRFGSTIVAIALPLTIVLFVLFPRIQGPLWGTPDAGSMARSGLSSTMSPGSVAQLALSDEIAFRVRFLDGEPPRDALYWRAIVMGMYDGRTWQRDATQGRNADPIRYHYEGRGYRYEITQEATRHPWLFALELPEATPSVPGNRVRMTPDIQLVATRPITDRIRYEVRSYPASRLQDDARADAMRDWLILPTARHPQTLALAARLKQTHAGTTARIEAVLNLFRTQAFRYTLEPPLLTGDTVDTFLFTTRAGFCEHYASAFVVLMRAMDIPARVVTGYQGGQMNPVDGFMTVRQSDAHAWAEVWLPNRGWLRVDPTAAVAPERVERPMTTDSTMPGAFGALLQGDGGFYTALRNARFYWEAVNNSWNQWILGYTPERQKSLLDAFGFGNIDWQEMLWLAALGMGVLMVFAGMLALLQRKRRDPVEALHQAFCKRMAQLGLPRLLHEGPRAYAQRLRNAPTLNRERKTAAQQFLMHYETYRYGDRFSQQQPVTPTVLRALLKRLR
ncbi:DUF3488 and transglutaminase-like domain-containing protein [uncultured Oxalicibacterium sp.]|uniref:transglutaminase TgpA family protein n=1 Tax=uncultured Oxalicibacterium sp. TaxID=1168540 RepID=UPI0025FD94F6|nr:DUF3488 and transglutaminase-like domain-containing protein [uncultured Oxalicibacterium sp.]